MIPLEKLHADVTATMAAVITRHVAEMSAGNIAVSDQIGPSLCDTCKSPGACCRGFSLSEENGESVMFDLGDETGPYRYVLAKPFPFVPAGFEIVADPMDGALKRKYRFSCVALGENGRCKIHSTRPGVCRRFEAGSNPLCVHYTDSQRPE